MASGVSVSTLQLSLMPIWAITTHELRSLVSGWLVRLWFLAAAIGALLVVFGNWPKTESALLISTLLASFLVFPWFFVVVALGISPVTGSRLEALADGILSRPVTRFEYLLAALLARVALVWGVYLAVTVPGAVLVACAKRPVPDDGVTLYGVIVALCVVALVLAFLVALAFCLGTMLRNAMLATAVLVFVWLPANVALDTFSLKEFSPLSLSRSMPSLLRTPWNDDGSAETGVPSMKELQAMAQIFGVIGGGVTPVDEPEGKFFQQGDYRDFPLGRVVLGYGVSTLLAFGLSLLFFCWRDL